MRTIIILILLFCSFNVKAQFSLDAKTDMILLPLGVIGASVGNIMTYEDGLLTNDDFAGIDKLNIPFFDRWNTTYNPTYAEISDILLALQFVSPLTYSFASEYKSQFQTNAIMYIETMSINYGLNSITKSLVGRFRPFSYDSTTIKNILYDNDTKYSFYSGHSSTAFASAIFNIIVLTSKSGGLNKTLGVTLNIMNATAIATLRVMAGKHFFSDVLVGAIVGSGVAYLTTELHKNQPKTQANEFEPMRFNLSIPF